ncbi:MAG: hypothetical protein M1353_12440 [Nitrospirae bacterium]|nr:hypothetical protein [Nitrospirota bacterium]
MPQRLKCISLCYRVGQCMLSDAGASMCKGPYLNFDQHMEAVRGMMAKEKVSFIARLSEKKRHLNETV